MPAIHLTEQDLVRHPHIRQLIGDEVPKKEKTVGRRKNFDRPRRERKYETRYRILQSGIIGFAMGTAFMGIMMVI